MSYSFLNTLRQSIHFALNKDSSFFKNVFGDSTKTNILPILQSSDINKGAIVNELDFALMKDELLYKGINPFEAIQSILELSILAYINLKRSDVSETDESLLARVSALLVQRNNPRRSTKWAIIDALSHLVPKENISVIEWFSIKENYFQVRIRGQSSSSFEGTAFVDLSYIDQAFLSGVYTGTYDQYVLDTVDRVKAGGVDFDVFTVQVDSVLTEITAKIV